MKTHDLHYQLIASEPRAHIFTSIIHIKHAHDQQEIWLPNWIPGSYKIRDFCKFIISVSAKANGKAVTMTQLSKNRWRVESPSADLEITAKIYGWDISVRGCHFDQTHGFFNGTHAFFAVEGQENNPCSVELIPPEDHAHWKCATAMTPLKIHRDGFGIYQADNYDELIDHPIEMGPVDIIEFKVQEVPHQIVLTGVYDIDAEKLAQDLEKLCSAQIRLFGEFPSAHYKILCHVMGKAFNGLEHRASAKIVISRKNMPYPGMLENGEDYATFLSLVSHEYFHTWNVKRIKPEAFMPYHLERECYTRQLWICEGFTSYYEDLMLVRAGLITPELFLKMFAEKMTSLLNGPGHLVQSVTDSSFCAWDKFYDPNENSPNTVVSYYTKGAVIAFMIDAYLRENTVFSLDDIMRLLWKDFGKVHKGVPEGWLENYLDEISEGGLKPLLHAWLHEASELPIEEYAAILGLEFIYEVKDQETLVELGIKTDSDNNITVCYTHGAAQKAGLSAHDKLIALDGISVASDEIDILLRTFRPGDAINVHAFRRDELMKFEVILQPKLPREVKLKLSDVQEEVLKRRDAWLAI